ncbi:MAG: hypothetical protein ACYC61_29215 [Isosphaeraceae bacterium]
MNPLQTPLLIFGTCSQADFPEYERYFNETYRRDPVFDRYGRLVKFAADRAHHVCFANPRHDQKEKSRPVWREDRAMRIPWIQVALTHRTSVLKRNKEPGMWGYLVPMQIIEPELIRNYYQVLVEPRRGGTELKFISAFMLSDDQWRAAMSMRSIRSQA